MRAEVYRLLRGWNETTATWNRPATGQTWAKPAPKASAPIYTPP